jgi:hypothetical protein
MPVTTGLFIAGKLFVKSLVVACEMKTEQVERE